MMHYQAISPHIRMSCYGCLFFLIGTDMLTGHCMFKNEKKSAIGTCNAFTNKSTQTQLPKKTK